MMKIAIITACTNRKKIPPSSLLCANNLPVGDQNDLLYSWKKRVNESPYSDRIPVTSLYAGRGFFEILKTIKNNHKIQLWVVSAGLGLVNGEEKVPSYNLTISPSTRDSIQNKLIDGMQFDYRSWWHEINSKLNYNDNHLSSLIKARKDTIFVISLPKSYLDFVASDLFSLDERSLSRVRFLGSNSISFVPEIAKDFVMPYDERFDGPESINPGTRSDFFQRITRHFVECILPYNLSATHKEHAKTVQDFLLPMRLPLRVKRAQKTNKEIEKIIKKNWDECAGSSAKMLRILRDNELVACEQSRFAIIFKQLKLQ